MSDQPSMLVWDKQSKAWKLIMFNAEFGLGRVRQTAALLRNNGVPACAVTPRMRGER